MGAKKYARLMREELYRQNKSVLEVTDDLWLSIADNMEKFAEWAVEEYKERAVEQLEKAKTNFIGMGTLQSAYFDKGIDKAIEIVKSGGAADD